MARIGHYFKFFFLIAISLFALQGLMAQNERYVDPYFENYTTANRMPMDKITDGFIDDHGFWWFVCVRGIMRFDGYDFKIYKNNITESSELLEGRTQTIIQDKNGYLWIGGFKGLTRLDPNSDELVRVSKDPVKYPLTGPGASVMQIGPNENLWISDKQGVSCINVDDLSVRSWKLFEGRNNRSSYRGSGRISWDKLEKNILWVGSEYGLVKLNVESNEFEFIQTPAFIKNKEKDKLEYDFHTYIYADSSGHVYSGRWGKGFGKSRNEGMHIFNTKDKTWQVVKLPVSHPGSQSTREISYKSRDELWIKTPNRGLGIFNKKTHEFIFISKDPDDPISLAHNNINVFMLDDNENLIIGHDPGLSISYKKRSIFQYHELFPKEIGYDRKGFFITDILETDSLFYVVSYSGGGLCIVDKASSITAIIPLSSEDRHPFNAGLNLVQDHTGKIYITSREGLKVYDPKTKKIEPFKTSRGKGLELYSTVIYRIIEDKKNRLWVGTAQDGLIQISENRDSIVYHKPDENDPNSFVSLAQIRGLNEDDKGRIWAATLQGVSCYDPSKKLFVNYSENFEGDNYFPTHYGYNVTTDTMGRNWVTSDVFYGIDESKSHGSRIQTISAKDGLPGSFVRGMKKHPDGTLWIVSDNGLVHFNPYDKFTKVYSTKEGLARDQMWDEFLQINNEGKVRLIHGRGFLEYHPEYEQSVSNGKLAFTKFEINGKEVNGYKEINSTDTIRLHHSQNFISFTYAMLNYDPKMSNTYSYKLEGLDKEWIDAGMRRFTEYTNLDGGYYTFKVKGKDKLGNEADNVLRKVIFIATPFWNTGWFKTLVGLLIFCVIYLIYKRRIATIRREKDLRTRLAENEMIALRAQMNPHFLFNTINSIKRFIIKNETTIAADHLTKFSRLVRLILNNSNSRSIPLSDEVEALKLYIEMELMRFDDKFSYSISVDDNLAIDDLEIPPMLMQPFVENAIWHGLMHKVDGEGFLKIDIKKENGFLECIIEDNGVGREKAAVIKSKSATKKKSLGMTLTQRRIELLETFNNDKIINLEIKDLFSPNGQARGTCVIVRIPVASF